MMKPLHSEIDAWARSFTGKLDYLDFASSRLSLPDWLAVARLFRPSFVEVSGCVLWDRVYEPKNFQAWYTELDGAATAIESVLNRARLWQFIDIDGEEDEKAINALAGDIAFFWRKSLEADFPEKEFEVSIIDIGDGPEVGFIVRRPQEYSPHVSP
ncbi:hypothetical protein K378_02017 [Streptomyces sp. Amel2xB2]|uniref:hypothetical protein n=1 Tax=Streptomyces sp. Amel2xB2 TaxID=1305829 RepID=UPI000DB90020|nr:hypothetical protein [Streptomyces sp. Amel2xB2]RAJ69127.1 hypothetical protein K378_02017 [Streptomyces sp. Amel2xB2]